jgi:hypothetical protein
MSITVAPSPRSWWRPVWPGLLGGNVAARMGSLIKKRRKRMRKKKHKKMLRRTRHQRRK